MQNSKESIKMTNSKICNNIVYRYPTEKCPYKCMPSIDCKKYVRKTKEKQKSERLKICSMQKYNTSHNNISHSNISHNKNSIENGCYW